jgi:uncharacterized delta-60 repeat protein
MKNSLLFTYTLLLLLTLPVTGLSAEGDLDATFDVEANDKVHGLWHQADGKILIMGLFTEIEGQPRARFARLFPNGSLDTSFNPSFNGTVTTCMVEPDGKILVGGSFTTVNGTTTGALARLNADGGLDTSFSPNVTGGQPAKILLQPDGKILIQGGFTSVGGQTKEGFARLNPDGTLDGTFSDIENVGSSIRALAFEDDGNLLVGGTLFRIGGSTRDVLARFDLDGVLDINFNPRDGGGTEWIGAMAVQNDGQILVGGRLFRIATYPANGLARLNPDGTNDTSFTLGLSGSLVYVNDIDLQCNGDAIIAGNFEAPNGLSNGNLMKISPSGQIVSSFDPNVDNSNGGGTKSATLLTKDGSVITSGFFRVSSGAPKDWIAKVSNATATESLEATSQNRIQWLRGGSAPEVDFVTFESSSDGANWTLLGNGTRISGGWELEGLGLSVTGFIRARGVLNSSNSLGGGGVYETVTAYSLLPKYVVNFVLDGKATRTGGGLLSQSIEENSPATAPVISANPGWIFNGWDAAFDSITANLTVRAQYLVDLDNTQPDQNATVTEDWAGGDSSQLSNTIEAASMTVADGVSFQLGVNEVLELNDGPLVIGEGATFEGNGVIDGDISNDGLLILRIVEDRDYKRIYNRKGYARALRVEYNKRVIISTLDNEGTFATDGSLEIEGNFTQTSSGVLRLFAQGNEPGESYSQLTVGDNVMLDGEVQLVLNQAEYGLFHLEPGDSFDLIQINPNSSGKTIQIEEGLRYNVLATEAIENQLNTAGIVSSTYTPTQTNDPDNLVEISDDLFEFELINNGTILRATFLGITPPTGALEIISRIPSVDTDPASDDWEIANGFDPNVNDMFSLDSDGDGDTDIWEIFQGTNPFSGFDRWGLKNFQIFGGSRTMTITYRSSTLLAATSVVDAIPKWSSDLQNWYESGESDGNIIVTLTGVPDDKGTYAETDMTVEVVSGSAPPRLYFTLEMVAVEESP